MTGYFEVGHVNNITRNEKWKMFQNDVFFIDSTISTVDFPRNIRQWN